MHMAALGPLLPDHSLQLPMTLPITPLSLPAQCHLPDPRGPSPAPGLTLSPPLCSALHAEHTPTFPLCDATGGMERPGFRNLSKIHTTSVAFSSLYPCSTLSSYKCTEVLVYRVLVYRGPGAQGYWCTEVLVQKRPDAQGS